MRVQRRADIPAAEKYRSGFGQIIMISVGSIIGGGFLVGTGNSIRLAGPSLIQTYLLVGAVTISVNLFLIEMSLSPFDFAYFHQYVGKALGPLAGTTTGWAYIMGMVIGPASEIIIAGVFLCRWFPRLTLLPTCVAITGLLIGLSFLGGPWLPRLKYITAFLRVLLLLGFGLLGIASMFGLFAGSLRTVGLTHYPQPGSFFPHGIKGTFAASVGVVMAYGGTESIGILSERDAMSNQFLPSASYSIAFRVVFLYGFSIAMLVNILPWYETSAVQSPFAQALALLNCPPAVLVLFYIILILSIASLVVTDTVMTLPLLRQLIQDSLFPRLVSKGKDRTGKISAAVTMWMILLVSVLTAAWDGETAFLRLFYLSGLGFVYIWIMITLSHPRYRRLVRREFPQQQDYWQVPCAGLFHMLVLVILLAGILCFAFFPLGRQTLLISFGWIAAACIYYRRQRRTGKKMSP